MIAGQELALEISSPDRIGLGGLAQRRQGRPPRTRTRSAQRSPIPGASVRHQSSSPPASRLQDGCAAKRPAAYEDPNSDAVDATPDALPLPAGEGSSSGAEIDPQAPQPPPHSNDRPACTRSCGLSNSGHTRQS